MRAGRLVLEATGALFCAARGAVTGRVDVTRNRRRAVPLPVGVAGTCVRCHCSAMTTPEVPAERTGLLAHAGVDVPAGVVVFVVAVPLCLAIAQASAAPLLSGLIAGVVGGLVVGALSGSALSVSGPAAGLAVIVASGIGELGARAFFVAVALAGVLQVVMGACGLGTLARRFPSSVIKGMLAAIGVLIIAKQAPHVVGMRKSVDAPGAASSLDGLLHAITPGAVFVSLACAAALLLWPRAQRMPRLQLVPPALIAVLVGVVVAPVVGAAGAGLRADQFVALPVFSTLADAARALVAPDFARIADLDVWTVALTLAIVASIETLLSLEAIDRLDPLHRTSPPNRELVAQGVGNLCSGLLGGLPITSVIVRSSANVQAHARTRLSTIVHGAMLLLALFVLAPALNRVPLAALAIILVTVGLKLTTPALWRAMWRAGAIDFVPFAATVVAIVATNLLTGTIIGVVVAVGAHLAQRAAASRSAGSNV